MIADEIDDVPHSLCKLLVALGDHSVNYIALHLTDIRVQSFLKLIFTFTALSGYYGIDEEESELTMSFWYLLQEALWSVEFPESNSPERDHWIIANALYKELVVALKRKVTYPPRSEFSKWPKGMHPTVIVRLILTYNFRST